MHSTSSFIFKHDNDMRTALRRVVVTGVGLVAPLGVGVKHAWPRLLAGHTGIRSTVSDKPSAFDTLPSRVAGTVPRGSIQHGGWDPRDHLSKDDERNMALFSQYAVAAAEEALKDSGVMTRMSQFVRESAAVVIGSGIGNLEDQHDTSVAFERHGHHKTRPLYVPRLLINMAAGHIAMRHGFQGANLAPTTACTTGLHAIIEGAQLIQNPAIDGFGAGNMTDVVVAGASEACVYPLAISGFGRARSLSTSYNDNPERASRPFDRQRDGFVIGEGAGVVVLEERERALERGATIYGELVGAGMSCDASHMTAPPGDGKGARLAMERALHGLKRSLHLKLPQEDQEDAGPGSPDFLEYINAHATGTSVGDAAENRAISDILQAMSHDRPRVPVSSTKGATGHLLGAAGAVEAIFTLLSMHHGGIPPTLNLESPGPSVNNDPEAGIDQGGTGVQGWDLDYVTAARLDEKPSIALTNSFGFGGTNASMCFRSHHDE
ncbi:MAG: hypothetical protein Q9162_001043 [Coniocarpon cinnabarinum]